MADCQYSTMRLKARGLAQHGGPPGWLEKSDPACVILYMVDLLFSYLTGCPDRSCPTCVLMEFLAAVIK